MQKINPQNTRDFKALLGSDKHISSILPASQKINSLSAYINYMLFKFEESRRLHLKVSHIERPVEENMVVASVLCFVVDYWE